MEDAERAMAEQTSDFEYSVAAAQLAEAAAQLRVLRMRKRRGS
jgi:F-type H+-transporting ATPase subunit epsilon